MRRFQTGVPLHWRNGDMITDGDDFSVAFRFDGFQRLPIPAANNFLEIDLSIFLSQQLVALCRKVNALRRGILIFWAGANEVSWIIDPDFPLCQRGGGAVRAGIL